MINQYKLINILETFFRFLSRTNITKNKIFLETFYFFYQFYKIIFEKKIILYLCKFIKENSIVIDVGANIGIYSHYFQKKFKKIKIICIEADKKNFNYLKKKFKTNNKLVLINKIASNKNKFYYLKNNKSNPTGHYINTKKYGDKILGITLDNFLQESKKKISLIKIDVEGAEGLVVEGSKKIIKKYKPAIYLEYSPERLKKYNSFDPLYFLSKYNYEFHIESKNKFEKTTISEIKNFTKKNICIDILCLNKGQKIV